MADKPHSFTDWWSLVKSAGESWLDDYAPSMGAALSYYTVFSLAPLLLIVVSIAGLVFGQDAANGEIRGQLEGLMGREAAKAVQDMLSSLSQQPAHGVIGTIVGVVVSLFGATTVFGELQDALDRIWRAPARNKASGLWGLLRTRLLSFGMILSLAFLLMVSLVLGAVISALGKWWGPYFGDWEVLAQIVNVVIGFVLTTAVFAIIYKLMPRVDVRWRDVALGALVTSLLFTFGKFLIGFYIGKSGVASAFGAAGSIVIVFVWVYYSAQIFLLGAEFTWVYARTFGSMRDLAQADDPGQLPAPVVPSRSGKAVVVDEPAALAGRGDPGLAASREAGSDGAVPPPQPASRPSPPPPTPSAQVTGVGIGVVAALALRYLVPRLLRRL